MTMEKLGMCPNSALSFMFSQTDGQLIQEDVFQKNERAFTVNNVD